MSDNQLMRYIGKVKERLAKTKDGVEFPARTIMLDNPNPVNKDGTPNSYHKGILLWCDKETGRKYQVKQLEFGGVGEKSKQNGFVNSIKLNLSDTYHVDDLG